jgi:hypothetical protein
MICMVTSRSSGFGAGLSCAIADSAARHSKTSSVGFTRQCMIPARPGGCKMLGLA